MSNLDESMPNDFNMIGRMGNMGAGGMPAGMGAGLASPGMSGFGFGAGAMGGMGNMMNMANAGMGMGPMGMPLNSMGLMGPNMMNSNMMGGGMGGPGGNMGPNAPHGNHHHNHAGHHPNQNHQDVGQGRRGGKHGGKAGYGNHQYMNNPNFHNNSAMPHHQQQYQHQQHHHIQQQRQAPHAQTPQTSAHTQPKKLSVGASEFVPSQAPMSAPARQSVASPAPPALTSPQVQAPSTPASAQAQVPGMQQTQQTPTQQTPVGSMQPAQHAQVPGMPPMAANVQQNTVPQSPMQVPAASPMHMPAKHVQTTPSSMHAGASPSPHVAVSPIGVASLEPLMLTPQTDPSAAGALHTQPPVGTAQGIGGVKVSEQLPMVDQGLAAAVRPQYPWRVPGAATPVERSPAASIQQAPQQLEQDVAALSPLTTPALAGANLPTRAASSSAPGASSSVSANGLSQSALYGLLFRSDQLVGPAQDAVWGPSHGEGLNSNGEFEAQDLGTVLMCPLRSVLSSLVRYFSFACYAVHSAVLDLR